MRPYAAIVSARFRLLLQYRAAAAAGCVTQLFWGLIRMMVFEAFYRTAAGPHPMRFEEVRDYVWLGQVMFAMLAWAPDAEVRQMMRSGTVAYEMLRPVDVYTLWYARSVAARTAPTLMRAVPVFAVAYAFFGLRAPAGWQAGVAWAACTVGALALGCALSVLLTIALMWTVSGEGLVRLAPSLVYTLSGMILPIPLFPDWAARILEWLPFRGMVDAPFRVYAGHIPASQVGAVLAHQLAWTLALVLFGRWLLARGARRLVVQGG